MTERLTLTVNLWDAWSFLSTPSTCDGICTLGRWSRKNKFPNAAKCTSLIKDEWLWWTRVRWDLKDLWKIKAWRKWSNSGEPIFILSSREVNFVTCWMSVSKEGKYEWVMKKMLIILKDKCFCLKCSTAHRADLNLWRVYSNYDAGAYVIPILLISVSRNGIEIRQIKQSLTANEKLIFIKLVDVPPKKLLEHWIMNQNKLLCEFEACWSLFKSYWHHFKNVLFT